MKANINYKTGKQEVINDVNDFLNFPDKIAILKKRNTSSKRLLFFPKNNIKSIKIYEFGEEKC